MILSKQELNFYIEHDSLNYQAVTGVKKWWRQLYVNPISDQWYIWNYIKTLRMCEYHINNNGLHHKLLRIWYLHRLRIISKITGFQIPPNTVGPGLTIWHWGPIIVNPKVRIGENCTLNPMIVIGHKNEGEGAPQIGNNVFIGGGAKIIGSITIGDNVIIAPNAVVVKDIPSDVVIGGIPCEILKRKV